MPNTRIELTEWVNADGSFNHMWADLTVGADSGGYRFDRGTALAVLPEIVRYVAPACRSKEGYEIVGNQGVHPETLCREGQCPVGFPATGHAKYSRAPSEDVIDGLRSLIDGVQT